MKRISPRYSMRGRLLLLAVGVELVMLTILVANSLRLLHGAMIDQARWQTRQLMPVLSAALTAPLAQRDYATVQAVITESRATEGIDYIVVTDRNGHHAASSGWTAGERLPEASGSMPLFSLHAATRYDEILPLVQSGQRLGTLHLGLNLSHITSARHVLLSQGIGIAAAELFLSSLILALIGYWLTRNLSALTDASLKVASGDLTPTALHESSDDIGQLGAAFNMMSRAIAERVDDLTRATEALAAKQEQLESLNQSLQVRIDESVDELRRKDQVLISQSRQAAMGEMIGNIAHQWRQPINALAMLLGNIRAACQYGELTPEYVEKSFTSGNRLIQKMSTTINDFRNFFKPDKEMTPFSAAEQVRNAVELIESAFTNHNITISINAPRDCTLYGFPNEYSQVLLNLLTNARDAIIAAGTRQGAISLSLTDDGNMGTVTVRDNGGGIPPEVLDKIFEPYFSTKQMGTGIGLYMSMMIIEKNMNGTIVGRSRDEGAEFTVSVPLAAAVPQNNPPLISPATE